MLKDTLTWVHSRVEQAGLEPLYPYNSTNPLSHIKAKLDK